MKLLASSDSDGKSNSSALTNLTYTQALILAGSRTPVILIGG
ncbi:hypothetical protein DOT_4514 [Desulfosporosinus sp. OT]|nr:hypothetical protein DOT_4514 [Desulfosporosinus sp. OT]